MIKNQTRKANIASIEFWCSIAFFFSLVLNDTFGEAPGFHIISKGVILLFMALTAFYIVSRDFKIPVSIIILFGSSLLWWILSALWTDGSVGFLSTLAQNVLLGFLVYCYFSKFQNYDLLLYAMFFSGFVLIAYSFVVYGVGGFFALLQEEERVGEGIANSNTYGRVFSYGILAGLYLTFYKKKWLCLLGCLLFLGFSLSSGSRKAILIIIIGSLVMLFLRYGLKRPFAFLLASAAVLLILYAVIQLPMFSVANERFTMLLEGSSKDYSTNERNDMIDAAIELFKQKPVAGWGVEGFADASGYGRYCHNNFLEILANYGIIGFILYYSIHAYILIKLLTKLNMSNSDCVVMFTIVLTSLIMDYGNVSYGIKWMWIILGAGLALAYKSAKENRKNL